ncbi:MAG: polysaccharide biosynthesis protein [Acidimicrobiales bacterium]
MSEAGGIARRRRQAVHHAVRWVAHSTAWDRAVGITHRIRHQVVPGHRWLITLADLIAWGTAFAMTVVIGQEFGLDPADGPTLVGFALPVLAAQALAGNWTGLYVGRFRVGGADEAMAVATAWTLVTVTVTVVQLALPARASVPLAAVALCSTLALVGMGYLRLLWRRAVEWELRWGGDEHDREPVVVVGAAEAGHLIVRAMLTDPGCALTPVALLDDDPLFQQRSIMGIQVEGRVDDLVAVARRHDARHVVIAIPSASSALIGRVVDRAVEAHLDVRTLPATSELAGPVTLSQVRPITENDLLGRQEVQVDLLQIASCVTGKRVLVTGAGGSIGSELCRQLHRLGPACLLMLDRDESGLHATQLSIEGRALLDSPCIIVADIRDQSRIRSVFERHRPQVVFHAAALKHLTLLEQHPCEAVKTNVFGTANVLDAARAVDTERVVNISTDKAADPTSVLGATKRLAELLAADTARRDRGVVVNVRFGNVLGSRGSVLPTFLAQIAAGGPVTVTDPDATRYFMTIPEAVRLVLQAAVIGRDAETLILDMGEPVRIVDLARRLIAHHDPTVQIEFTGLRPGEKLHEILIGRSETGAVREHPRVLHTPSGATTGLAERLAYLVSRPFPTAAEVIAVAVAPEPPPQRPAVPSSLARPTASAAAG